MTTLRDFLMESHQLLLLMLLHTLVAFWAAGIHGPGWDEVGHLPAGLTYWRSLNTDQYRVNPPLARAVGVLPLAAMDIQFADVRARECDAERPEFMSGLEIWRTHGYEAYQLLVLARRFNLIWSLVCLLALYYLASSQYSRAAGFFSCLLWSFSPLVLANAELLTPDICCCAFALIGTIFFLKWEHSRTWEKSILFGIMCGLMLLSKFTLLILLPLWSIAALVQSARRFGTKFGSWNIKQFAMSLLIALWIVNIAYGFEGTFTKLGDYCFVSSTLTGANEPEVPGNRFSGTVIGELPIPLPKNIVLGVDRQKLDFEIGLYSYMNGEWKTSGWWYYYIFALCVKEPISTIVLLLGSVIYTLRIRCSFSELILVVSGTAILVFVSSQTGFNHHVRYVLPGYVFFFPLAGKLYESCKDSTVRFLTIWSLMLCSLASSISVLPDSFAHFNAVSRFKDPLLLLSDSNIDWGQGSLQLARWVNDHPDKHLDGVAYPMSFLIDLRQIGIPTANPPVGIDTDFSVFEGTISHEGWYGPRPGRYAIFAREASTPSRSYDYFRHFEPIEIISHSIYLYEISEADVVEYWERKNREYEE